MATNVVTTYGNLKNGDRVWVQGYLMIASNVRTVDIGFRDDVKPAVRFEGQVVDRNASIAGTGYDGGTYGGIPSLACTISVD